MQTLSSRSGVHLALPLPSPRKLTTHKTTTSLVSAITGAITHTCTSSSGADPDRFPPFHGNRSTYCPSDSKYPEMALRGVKTKIFPGRVILEARTFSAHIIRKRSQFFLDPRLILCATICTQNDLEPRYILHVVLLNLMICSQRSSHLYYSK